MEACRKKRFARWRALLCMVCVVFALFSVATEASAAETASVSGVATAGERGETVVVLFNLSGNPGVWGIKGEISYDASVMTLKKVEAGNVFSSSEIIMGEDKKQNPMVFLATGNTIEDKKSNGVLIKAFFLVDSDAAFGDYTVGLKISQFINTAGEDVPCTTSGAKVTIAKCLHRSTELKNEVPATEEKEGYSGDTYCKNCQALLKKGTATPKLENTCKHPVQERVIITEPTCEQEGYAKIICTDCRKELTEVDLPLADHVEGAPKNAKPATTTEEGYTGDIYCEHCDELLKQGQAIPKIKVQVFSMTLQTEDTYVRDSSAGLIFVSEAELETFVRVEVNGTVLTAENYTLESGSTKVTLKPEYLETLPDGKHTVTIVSDAGTASAQFYVAAEKEGGSYGTMLAITIIAVVITVACVAVTVFLVMREKKNGRREDHDA